MFLYFKTKSHYAGGKLAFSDETGMRELTGVMIKNSSLRAFLVMLVLSYFGTLFAQSKEPLLSFDLREEPLGNILDTIEEETGRVFIYNSLHLDLEEKCSLKVKDAGLSTVLTLLLQPLGVFYKIYGKQIVVADFSSFKKPLQLTPSTIGVPSLDRNVRTVFGVVLDAMNQPIPGVNVILDDGARGTITNVDGQFSIEVKPESRLTFSHIGFEKHMRLVGYLKNLRVVLVEHHLPVPEIVVTALDIKRDRKALGYAHTELAGSVICGANSINPVTSLMGQTAGLEVQPTDGGVYGSSRITIRGNSTFRENNQPVFVVDGIIMDNSTGGGDEWGGLDWGNTLKSLNPDDFESVTILKGAAAAALYGSKAMNGVVLITSKKGKQKSGVGVNVSQTFHVKSVYAGPDFQDVYGAGTVAGYATYLEDRFAPSSGFRVNGLGDPMVNSTMLSFGPPMDENTLIRYRDGEWIHYGPHPDNYLETFRQGLYSNSHVSIKGMKEEVSFRLSYSRTQENGVYYRNNFLRDALSGNLSYELMKQIRATLLFSYTGSQLWNPPSGEVQQAFMTGELGRDYDASKWKKTYMASHGGIPSADNEDPNYQIPGHSIWYSYYEDIHYRFEQGSRLIGRLNGDLFPWLSYELTAGLNNYSIRLKDKEPGQGFNHKGGYYGVGNQQTKQKTYRLLLNTERALGFHSRLKITLGAELFDSDVWSNYSNSVGGLMEPGKFSLEYSIEEPETNEQVTEQLQTQSIFLSGEWDWKDQIYLTFTGRNDWSSTLAYADGSGTLGFCYPSLSAAWVFSDTFDLPSWLLFGKLRASVAQVGNGFSAFSINQWFELEGRLQTNGLTIPLITHNENYARSKDIRPERKRALEVGTELSFFKNRVQIDFSWYHENTYDQIITVSAPPESGVDYVVKNAGNILNDGVELSLQTVPFKGDDFQLSAGFYFTKNRNRVVTLAGGVTELVLENSPTYGNARTASVAIEGEPMGLLMSDAAPLLYTNGNNSSDEKNGWPVLRWDEYARGAYPLRSNQKRVVGNINPDFYGAVKLGLNFWNFVLSGLFDYKIGGDVVSYSNRYGMAYGLLEGSMKYRNEDYGGISWANSSGNLYNDGMIPQGVFESETVIDGQSVGNMSYKEAYEQGLVEPVHASFWHYYSNSWSTGVVDNNMVLENSYIGIRSVSLSYSFSGLLFKNLKVEGGSLTLFGRNLGYIYKSLPNNMHPFGIRSNRAAASHEWGLSPYLRTIGLALTLNF